MRNAQERLRVALALAELPAIAAALENGTLPFTATRALLRVVTPQTQQQWLAHCANMSVHQIEEAVAGHARGDDPSDPRKADLELRALRYEDVRPSTGALEREALAKARAAAGRPLTDDESLAMVFGAFVEGSASANEDTSGRARYQVAVVVCEQCDQAWREAGGKRFALDPAEREQVRCDTQHVGSLDTADPARRRKMCRRGCAASCGDAMVDAARSTVVGPPRISTCITSSRVKMVVCTRQRT